MKPPLVEQTQTVHRINVTPIIDVALVLVIILLITAPMISTANMDVQLPAAQTRGLDDDVRLTITLGAAGEVAIDDTMVGTNNFRSVLKDRIDKANDRNLVVVVRADSGTSHVQVRSVLEEARAAGAKRLAIATRQRERTGR